MFLQPAQHVGTDTAQRLGALLEQHAAQMGDVGAGHERLQRVLRGVDAAGDGQRQADLAVQRRDPVDAQQRFVGRRQRQCGRDLARLQVDVRLIEAVEQRHALRPGGLQGAHEMANGTELRRQLHGDGDADVLLQLIQQFDVAALHLGAGLEGIGGDVIDVQLQCVGARLLQLPAVVHPAVGGDTVEAGDDGYGQAALERGDLLQIVVELAQIVLGRRHGQERFRLAEADGLFVEEARGGLLGGGDGLLEQRIHDDGRGAGILQPPRRVQITRQRRGRGHQRAGEPEAEIVRAEIDHDQSSRVADGPAGGAGGSAAPGSSASCL